MAQQDINEFKKSLVHDELITICMANNRNKPIKVSRALLTAASPWFQSALDKKFKEGEERVLRFPDAECDTVTEFLFWLFNARQLSDSFADQVGSATAVSNAQLRDVQLWIFADMHCLPDLCGAAMRDLHCKLSIQWPSTEVVRTAFEGTAADSPLRRVILKEVVFGMRSRAKGDVSAGFSLGELEKLMDLPGFAVALMKELGKCLVELSWQDISEID
ncbi:hypothetical protein D0862_13151 [Lecanosticta acicola]|uniref:BTB domain-containing protein n=1 Tax=Lecanosticta acicola TaxID=111012 RepID=A0AAI9ED74_9PEZI|nr:hypothetical protein D0862_13151 [Lecanosticta acicola]